MNIAVLGCGPAGTITAIGLASMGHEVIVVGKRRDYAVTEGISPRVYQAIASAGLRSCLQTISVRLARSVVWNGKRHSANFEYLINRPVFESALLHDLAQKGVKLKLQRIRRLVWSGGRWRIDCGSPKEQDICYADFLVDARGRSTRIARSNRLRGPETVTVAANWQSRKDSPRIAVVSVEQGWLWLAREAAGNCFVQFTTGSRSGFVPGKQGIRALIRRQLALSEIKELTEELDQAVGPIIARSSTPILVIEPVNDRYIRVGDAAMAVDPLSGNGIFQAMSSALIAPAVINTILKRPADSALAMKFYRDRLHQLFLRFARTGRDFYRMEQRWSSGCFWQERVRWPDTIPVHVRPDKILGTAHKAVVNHDFIEQAKVIVTADQPMGIWRIDNRIATEYMHFSRPTMQEFEAELELIHNLRNLKGGPDGLTD